MSRNGRVTGSGVSNLPGWRRAGVWATLVALPLLACETQTSDGSGPVTAGAGQVCAATGDCADGLQCVALVCMAVDAPAEDATIVDAGGDAQTSDAAAAADDTADTADVAVDTGPPAPTSDPDDVDDATSAISGRVLYSADMTPIRDALVTGAPGLGQVLTNADGQYLFLGSEATPIEAGALYHLVASRAEFEDGSATVTAQPGHNRDVDILLDPIVPDLPLGANPSSIAFDLATFGGSSTAIKQVVLFLNPAMPGVASMGFTVSIDPHDSIWLSVKPATGKVGKTPYTLIVTVDRSGLSGGTQGAFDVVPEKGDRLTIPVTVTSSTP